MSIPLNHLSHNASKAFCFTGLTFSKGQFHHPNLSCFQGRCIRRVLANKINPRKNGSQPPVSIVNFKKKSINKAMFQAKNITTPEHEGEDLGGKIVVNLAGLIVSVNALVFAYDLWSTSFFRRER